MSRSPRLRLIARAIAMVIALLALLDPAIERERYDNAVVALTHGPRAIDSATADIVRRSLAGKVRLVDGAFGGADARVYVGRNAPAGLESSAQPFIVIETEVGPTIRGLQPAASMLATERSMIDLQLEGLPPGNSATVTLREAGVAVDRLEVAGSPDSVANVRLGAVAFQPGVRTLRVEGAVRSGSRASVDVAMLTRDAKRRVLVWDTRPGWNATFTRRALEKDPAFNVVARSITSRAASSDVGAPPTRLDAPAALEPFDAIVVGAPDALTASEIDAIEQYLRRRGGSVLLLLDQAPNSALARLIGSEANWGQRTLAVGAPVHVFGTESTEVVSASEFVWPTTLPVGSEVLAEVRAPKTKRSPEQAIPALWSAPVGGGRLYVSGALDTWKSRSLEGTQFARFWQGVVGTAAARALPPLRITVNPSAVHPGELVSVRVEDRNRLLGTSALGATAIPGVVWHDSAAVHRGVVAMSPTGARGVSEGKFRAPTTHGRLFLTVRNGAEADSAALAVGPVFRTPAGDDAALLRAMAVSRGGSSLGADQLGELPSRLAPLLKGKARRGETHPMRSPWWIFPFALLLGFEWWARRRTGLA